MTNDVDIYKKFGERLKQLRKERNITQTQLAEAVGIAQPTIYKYERGIRKIPMNVLEKFANYFEISVTELICAEPDVSENCNPAWVNVLKSYELSDSEVQELMNYAKFIVSKRD